ncbi:ankyrin repeat family protein [Striga asiatica]|uniref:Ankyrin repeat family protein n=1 Tax=Striga asiatica TaxID=4170 RepID=A0A5A7PFS2_STRAF|nr:ankyrin repeat family protein [Striga asiatica]
MTTTLAAARPCNKRSPVATTSSSGASLVQQRGALWRTTSGRRKATAAGGVRTTADRWWQDWAMTEGGCTYLPTCGSNHLLPPPCPCNVNILKALGERLSGSSLDGVAFILCSDFLTKPAATYAVADGITGDNEMEVAPELRVFLWDNWLEAAFVEGVCVGPPYFANVAQLCKPRFRHQSLTHVRCRSDSAFRAASKQPEFTHLPSPLGLNSCFMDLGLSQWRDRFAQCN